ncbi:uncharacterized protein LOC107467720 [Arachis duranensis]|uniref:Uncharacterized protein LOC107467720 n=1 Tax=Arachis duranensis TaxID=130453 RepID=A0A6P4BM70_ARADU|nr:uncharacterized protein LOC107467720 [Arachis duranensis]
MPKKMGVNTKAEVARARKSAVESERKERETRAKEEEYWRDAEGPKSRAAKKKEEEADKRAEAAEEEYERLVLVSNTNRDDSVIEARSVDDAIAQMSIGDTSLPPDRHPERRLKASFKAFEEAELPKLKEEKPGLTHTQYKDLIWKLWKKSPDNPLNQIAE